MTTQAKRGKLGYEDVELGLGTFQRYGPTGALETKTQLRASHIPILDALSLYEADEIEGALAEIRAIIDVAGPPETVQRVEVLCTAPWEAEYAGVGLIHKNVREMNDLLQAAYTFLASCDLTDHGVLVGSGVGAITPLAAMTDGQLVVGATGADPVPKTMSSDATLAASGALTIANLAVTAAKLAANAVETAKIKAGAVEGSKLNANVVDGVGIELSGNTLTLKDVFALLNHEVASGVDGGATTANTWLVCPYNVEKFDPEGIVTLASNQFTLQAGTYVIIATHNIYTSTSGRLRIRNITDGTTLTGGPIGYCSTAQHVSLEVKGIVTIAAQKVFEIDYYCKGTHASGLGEGSIINSGENEVYGQVYIRKIA